MLVPICQECFNKYIKVIRAQPDQDHKIPKCKECLDIYMHIRDPARISKPIQKPGMPVNEYFQLFKEYASNNSISLNSVLANSTFAHGLSEKNSKEIEKFIRLHKIRPIDGNFIPELVCYLAYLEGLDDLFGKDIMMSME